MAENMGRVEQKIPARPAAEAVASRWMKIRGVEKPQEGALVPAGQDNPQTLIAEAYDLFVDRDELRADIVRKQRTEMEPQNPLQPSFGTVSEEWERMLSGTTPENTFSLKQKMDLVRQGKVGNLLLSSKGGFQEVVQRSQSRIQEIDAHLDQIFSVPGAYEQFQTDLSHQVELRRQTREVLNLERLADQISVFTLKMTRAAQVEQRSLTSVERQAAEENKALQEAINQRGKELLKDPEVFDRDRLMELKELQTQLRKDHYAETPSRKAYLEKIERAWAEGKRVLLTGETGTGKTKMVEHASNALFGVNPEYVTGHQDMSIYELLGKTGFRVQEGDVFRPAPLVRAMTGRDGKGLPFLFDEIDRAPNQAVMGIKTVLNARPGETGLRIQTDSNGSFDVGENYAVSATANIKNEKYTTATELDPAIVRMFDAPLDIDYMPAFEVYDVALAFLMDKRGGVPLSETEAQTTLKNLCDAASWIQDAYQGKQVVTDPGSSRVLEQRGQAATGKAASLRKALLDPGRTLDMLKGWSGAQTRGQSFEDYLNDRVLEFINNRAYPEEDRYYLTEIFALKGFLKGHNVSELLVLGLDQNTLNRWTGSSRRNRDATKSSYLSADRVARLDPYRRFKRPVAADAEELLIDEEEIAPEADMGVEVGLKFEEAKALLGKDFLGPEQIEKALGIKLSPESIPDIPFTQKELEQAKALGQFLILRLDKTPGGIPITMQGLASFTPVGKSQKLLYDTSRYENEAFYKTDTPKPKWALVSKEVIPSSTSKNYLQQTEQIASYLQTQVFRGVGLPPQYKEAIAEYQAQKASIEGVMTRDLPEATRRLSALKLNQLTRQTPVESFYDLLVYFDSNGERLMESQYTWTSTRSSGDYLVLIGYFDSLGADVDRYSPDASFPFIGVSFSRVV